MRSKGQLLFQWAGWHNMSDFSSPAQPTFLLSHVDALSQAQWIFKVFAANASQTFACYTELLY